MDSSDDLWTAIRRVLPGAEELAAAVAAELGEPLDDIRPSVLIGSIAMNGQLGPEAAAAAAIETELGGLQLAKGTRAQVASSRSTRSPTFWLRRRLSKPRVRWTSRRSWRSSALQARSRREPIAHWSSCSTDTQSPAA